MHPMLMKALASEVERDRGNERRKLELRSAASGVAVAAFVLCAWRATWHVD